VKPLSCKLFVGHGGKEAALLCQKMLHNVVLSHPALLSDPPSALKESFFECDKDILKVSETEQWKSGSTVVFVLVVNDTVYIANSGDSEVSPFIYL
jgi:integrin-linked kinase-associated serine/threonine phosphatase 2C